MITSNVLPGVALGLERKTTETLSEQIWGLRRLEASENWLEGMLWKLKKTNSMLVIGRHWCEAMIRFTWQMLASRSWFKSRESKFNCGAAFEFFVGFCERIMSSWSAWLLKQTIRFNQVVLATFGGWTVVLVHDLKMGLRKWNGWTRLHICPTYMY